MLNKLLAMTKAELKSKIQSIDASADKGRAMRRQLAGMKKKEGGILEVSRPFLTPQAACTRRLSSPQPPSQSI